MSVSELLENMVQRERENSRVRQYDRETMPEAQIKHMVNVSAQRKQTLNPTATWYRTNCETK